MSLAWSSSNETDWASLGVVEIRQDSVYPEAQQVYYLSHACQTKEHLKGWDIVHKVLPHGKLPLPNNEDYNFNPNTYDGEFFQEEGLDERFVID